jgi:hypothetical protein
MRRLRPTVDILLGLSASGDFGGIPLAKAIFTGIGLLLAVCIPSLDCVGSLHLILKAAKGVSTSYDTLIELFECSEHYLSRLKVLAEVPSAVGEILVKIMVQLLEVLALAALQLKQGRFSESMLVDTSHFA